MWWYGDLELGTHTNYINGMFVLSYGTGLNKEVLVIERSITAVCNTTVSYPFIIMCNRWTVQPTMLCVVDLVLLVTLH